MEWSSRSSSVDASAPSPWILCVEAVPERAALLRGLFDANDVELHVVESVEDAIAAMATRTPALILTPTFLAPADEASLAACVRDTPDAAHVQILTVPYFIDPEAAPAPSFGMRVMRTLRRRQPSLAPRCDRDTLRRQIRIYLDNAVVSARDRRELEAESTTVKPARLWLAARNDGPVDRRAVRADSSPIADSHPDRRRARRWRLGELPSIWSIRLPWGDDVKVVDISNRGVLLEYPSKLSPGTTVDLQVVGEDTNVSVAARMLRADVAAVDGRGVRYRMAAMFSRELDLSRVEPPAPDTGIASSGLGEVLTKLLADVGRHVDRATLRARFESEIAQLTRARGVFLRPEPSVADPATESIYFTVPSPTPWVLQVVFEPGTEPTAAEFRLLKAAAPLAAVVLEYASARSPRGQLLLRA